MRLGRRLSAGVAEHPPAREHPEPRERSPEPAREVDVPTPRAPAELADR